MKKIFFQRILPLACAVLMIAIMCAPMAYADPDTTNTAVTATSTSFNKVLVTEGDAVVPTITFAYSIEAGTGNAADATHMAILAPTTANGVTGSPTVGSVSFSQDDMAVGASGVTVSDGANGTKRYTKSISIDFSGVSFSEPGIYRYVLTETSAGQQGITYDSELGDTTNGVEKTRYLDVYVTATDSGLAVSEYVLHEVGGTIDMNATGGSDVAATLADKSAGFVNDYNTYDLTVTKVVSGNQASRDKYFAFEIAITNGGANTDLNVTISQTAPAKSVATIYTAAEMASANGFDSDNALSGAQWSLDGTGALTRTVYLKHNQQVVIAGLPAGANVTVTEAPEDYISNQTNATWSVTDMADDATAAFTNTREGVVPTGILLSAVPGATLIAVAGAGIFAFARKSKKKDEDDV